MAAKRSGTEPKALRQVQALFYELVTAPMGVEPGLIDHGLGAADLEAVIRGDNRLSAIERLDIYADMYFYRILDVLRDEFPRVVAVVGDVAFHDLITDYLLVHRPRSPSLREAGSRLPGYLVQHALGMARPWLPRLAHLERIHRELFDGADVVPLTLEGLRRMPPEAFATLGVRLCPAHAIVDSAFALSTIWTTCLSGAAEPEARGERLLVWRQDFEVRHRVIDGAGESAMLEAAAEGATMGKLCEVMTAAEGQPDASDLAARAFQILARWVDDGLLTNAAQVETGGTGCE